MGMKLNFLMLMLIGLLKESMLLILLMTIWRTTIKKMPALKRNNHVQVKGLK